MNKADFELFCTLVRERSGLVLGADKGYLLESRLAPIARTHGFASVDDLAAGLRRSQNDELAWAVTEAMTTNETFFFRDKTPFTLFREDILPGVLAKKKPGEPLRIWCAASSSGQEPYSLAMILTEEAHRLGGRRVEIVATDICTKALEKAKAGLYSQFEVQRGLPVQMLVKFFEKQGDVWRISPDLRRDISFQRFNLLKDYGGLGNFDVIFCRNVLIYFDENNKRDILARMAKRTTPPGYLLLGAAETIMGLSKDFTLVEGKRGLYVRDAAATAQAA